jgi:hypothetical protein
MSKGMASQLPVAALKKGVPITVEAVGRIFWSTVIVDVMPQAAFDVENYGRENMVVPAPYWSLFGTNYSL